jgi:hypothetical protein
MEYELIKINEDKKDSDKAIKKPKAITDWCGTVTLDQWDHDYKVPDYHIEEDIELFRM